MVSVLAVGMKTPAAIAQEQAARRRGDQFAERGNAILQRHRSSRTVMARPVRPSTSSAIMRYQDVDAHDKRGHDAHKTHPARKRMATHSPHRARRHECRTGARLDAAKQASGIVGGPYYAYIRLPKLFEAAQNLRKSLSGGPLSPARAADRQSLRRPALERALSVVCASAPLALRRHRSSVIDAINAHKTPTLTDAREKTCFVVAHELLSNKGLGDATYAAAEKTMGLESLVALVASIGSFSMTCMTAGTFRHRTAGRQSDAACGVTRAPLFCKIWCDARHSIQSAPCAFMVASSHRPQPYSVRPTAPFGDKGASHAQYAESGFRRHATGFRSDGRHPPVTLPTQDPCCQAPCDPPWITKPACITFTETKTSVVGLDGKSATSDAARGFVIVNVTYTHTFCLVGKQHGGLAYTLTLLPGEKMTLYHSDRYRRTTTETARYSVQTTFAQFVSALYQQQNANRLQFAHRCSEQPNAELELRGRRLQSVYAERRWRQQRQLIELRLGGRSFDAGKRQSVPVARPAGRPIHRPAALDHGQQLRGHPDGFHDAADVGQQQPLLCGDLFRAQGARRLCDDHQGHRGDAPGESPETTCRRC